MKHHLYKLLTNEQSLKNAKMYDNIEIKCSKCNSLFLKHKRDFLKCIRLNRLHIFCSHECHNLNMSNSIDIKCKQCNKQIRVNPHRIIKYKNAFCSQSCSATYTNAHKTHGTTVSKLEKWLSIQLTSLYPKLEFHFNRKDTINSELDIYIPSLKLAFELNGIFHYEPIFGKEQLDKIQNNDNRKYQACLEQKIELCIIDSSKQKCFKESASQNYLDIITNIINNKNGAHSRV